MVPDSSTNFQTKNSKVKYNTLPGKCSIFEKVKLKGNISKFLFKEMYNIIIKEKNQKRLKGIEVYIN